jgi:hypothetical protein
MAPKNQLGRCTLTLDGVKTEHLIRLPYFLSFRSQAGSDIMATDWDGVRATALDFLNATWGMVCWAARLL